MPWVAAVAILERGGGCDHDQAIRKQNQTASVVDCPDKSWRCADDRDCELVVTALSRPTSPARCSV